MRFLMLALDIALAARAVWRFAACSHRSREVVRLEPGFGSVVFRCKCTRCGAELVQEVQSHARK